MVPLRARRVVPVVTLAAAFLMAGCGSGSSALSSNGVASKTAIQIYNAARKATTAATSVRYSGRAENGGKAIVLDIVAAGKRGGGSISISGATLNIVADGTALYLKATAASWKALGAGAAASRLVANRWLQTSTSNQSFADFTTFTDLSKLLGSTALKTTPKKGKQTTIDGQKAITLSAPGKGSLLVATTGKPYILEITSTQPGDSGTITFSGYDSTKPPAVPTNAINISSLSGSG